MATEAVLDDSKNESGIPRAVFVVCNFSSLDTVFRLDHISIDSSKIISG